MTDTANRATAATTAAATATDGAAPDFIDQAVPLDAAHPLHALRRERPKIVAATQASQVAMFGDAVPGLSRRHRLAVALHVCRLAGATGLAALYSQALTDEGAPPDHVQALGTDGVASVVSPRLAAMLHFAGMLTRRPLDGDRAAIDALLAAGLDAPSIVALAQLVAYLSYQVRLVAGLQAMAAAGPAPALRSDTPVTLAAPTTVAPAAAGAPALTLNGFTTATLDWQPWLPTVDLDHATPDQLAALDAMNATARQSVYFLLLAHQPELLLQRSIAFNAIMFAPGGLSRAERELGATVESRWNGCVYCTAVHAQRFEQLARRNDVLRQLFTAPEGAGTTPRERAIVAFSARIGLAPQDLAPADVQALRAAGLDDREVLDLVHAVALFAWANRLMLNLGEAVWPDGLPH
jgi:uncharacterized peroxidase-related enzyme